MSQGADRPRKVQIEAAVQMIADHIARSIQAGELQTGAVSLELQFCLDEQDGKLVPFVPLEGIEKGTPTHRLRFELGIDPAEIGRPDTSNENLMIMDHPPPREPQEVNVTISDSSKPPVAAKPQTQPQPPPPRGQEVAVTLSDRSRPVVEERGNRVERGKQEADAKATRPSNPPRAEVPPGDDQESEREPSLTTRESITETMDEIENKFAMLDKGSSTGEDDDEFDRAEETTVSDTIPGSDDPRPKKRKGPKIVLPSNPRLKLRKASDAEAMRKRKKPPVDRVDEAAASRADIDFDPPQPEEAPTKDVTDEVPLPSKVSQKFILFDHQKARRRIEPAGDGPIGDDTGDQGGEPSSGRTRAEG